MDSLILFEPFMIRAMVAGLGLAVINGVMGCFVVWRYMAYLGDSIAHGTILGIAIAVLYSINHNIATLGVALGMAILLLWMRRAKTLSTDTSLGILAHSTLAAGIMAISLVDAKPVNLHGYLFGDVLVISWSDILWMGGIGLAALGLVAINWSGLLLATISEDIARSEKINTLRLELVLTLAVAITVAASIRIAGVLLVAALLIIPAATAQQISRSPEKMVVMAVLFGLIAVWGGLVASLYLDTPSGPSITSMAAIVFFVVFMLAKISTRQRSK